MRKLANIICVFTIMSAYADNCSDEIHEYLPYLEVGKAWVYKSYPSGQPQNSRQYIVKIMQKIDENGMSIFLSKKVDSICETEIVSDDYETQWMEENGIVYFYDPYNIDCIIEGYERWDGWLPMIDFGVEEGDVLGFDDYHVIRKETIEIRGIPRTLITLEVPVINRLIYIIEGIGPLDKTYLTEFPTLWDEPSYKHELLECWKDGTCLFKVSDLNLGSIQCMTTDTAKNLYNLCDLNGIIKPTPQKGSLYIENNRKTIWIK